jgi:flagellar biosynthesis protein FlhG
MTLLLTSEPHDRDALVINLAASIASFGQKVIVVDGCSGGAGIPKRLGIAAGATLVDVALNKCTLGEAIHPCPQGFDMVILCLGRGAVSGDGERLEHMLGLLAGRCDILLISAESGTSQRLPTSMVALGDVIVQVSSSHKSIALGYRLIKDLSGLTGRRPFGILVTGATELQAAKIYKNLAHAASRYLALTLNWFGSVPPDELLMRAFGLGRSVVEAFPLAKASVAFRRIAEAVVNPSSTKPRSLPAPPDPQPVRPNLVIPSRHVHSDRKGG